MGMSKGEEFRQILEDLEERDLKPYALRSRERRKNLGKSFRDSEVKASLEYRSEYHRDRDRIVWSKSFKRLQHKTQIFPHYFEDHYKRRLTHSLEVAQIATTIARSLGLNEVATEAMALGHDLGHTPFGHAGEAAINEVLQAKCEKTDFDSNDYAAALKGFDHCVHAIEVVSRIDQEYSHESNHGGLNLTFDVRDGILKHMFDRATDPQRPLSTIPQVVSIPEYTLYRNNKGSLEAQCVYFADKVAYLFGDIEDGVRSNILQCSEIAKDELFDALRAKYSEYRGCELPKLTTAGDFPTFRSTALTVLILDCIESSTSRLENGRYRTIDDVLSADERIVQVSTDMEEAIRDFYDRWMRNFLFMDKDVVACGFKAKRIVKDLFEAYLGNQNLINKPYRAQCEQAYRDICEPGTSLFNLILVRNYVAGMTDFFATQQYARLFMSSERIRL